LKLFSYYSQNFFPEQIFQRNYNNWQDCYGNKLAQSPAEQLYKFREVEDREKREKKARM